MKRTRAGYTLLELVVATGAGSILTLSAVAFATHQTRALGMTTDQLELAQSSRSALDRVKADLRMAGAGVGYDAAGTFAGIEIGQFQRGGATFNSANHLINLENGSSVTDDLGITLANGDYATIAAFSPSGTGQLCAGGEFDDEDIVLIRSEDGLSARTVRLSGLNAAPCALGQCAGGCQAFGWSPDPSYLSGDEAAIAPYAGGEAAGNFQQVTWFVETTDPGDSEHGAGRLRRAEGSCRARDHNCGEVMLENVESLQIRVYERTRNGWIDRTSLGSRVPGASRIRVDIELVIRARYARSKHPRKAVTTDLEAQLCFPACGTEDHYIRHLVKTSVEIKNSGRLAFRRSRS